MHAKKFIDNRKVREIEVIRNHVIPVNEIDETEIHVIAAMIGMEDDPEDSYLKYGVAIDWDYKVAFFEVDKFVTGVKEYLKDTYDEELMETYEPTLEKLKKYSGYDIYLRGE